MEQSGNSSSNDDEDNHSENVIPFNGDLFGSAADYLSDDFGQYMDTESETNNEEELASENEDNPGHIEERLFDLQLENSWEPERDVSPMPQVDRDSDSDGEGDPPTEQRLIAEERADAHPQVVRYSDTYPSSRAGHPLPHSAASTDSIYARLVHGQDNLWAPFTSEMDWKVAHWAKLRGPGSTAFSDLLNIDGVSTFFSDLSDKVAKIYVY